MTPEPIPFPVAVRSGQIAGDDVTEPTLERARFPYTRITHWYLGSEEWMLKKAIAQLEGVHFIVVEGMGRTKAIYRRSREVVVC